MHAVVLAAGFGSRMSGITQSSPKPMIRIAGMTIIERIISSLRTAGLTKITVGCGWLADKMMGLVCDFDSNESLQCIRVPDYQIGPLQTLVTLLETVEEDFFLACPADYLVDSMLVSSFLSMSEKMNGASLCLAVDEQGNTGSKVYIRKDGSLAHIGSQNKSPNDGLQVVGRSAMLLTGKTGMRTEFRRLLEAGESNVRGALNEIAFSTRSVWPVPVNGFWHDIDTLADVISVLPRIIEEAGPRSDVILVKAGDAIEFGSALNLPCGTFIEEKVNLIGPVYIEESRIGSGCTIGPNVSIGKGTRIPSDCHIDNSILYCNPKLEPGLHITNMVAHSSGRMFGEN